MLSVRAAAANATTTPTFTPNNGTIAAATIVKGNNLPLVPGDISGAAHWITLQWDATLGKWILLNPATGISVASVPAGTIISWAGATAPAGYLQCPTSLSYISATSYSALAFAIGSTWGGSSNVAAGAFVVGQTYVISALGTTLFTSIGASSNAVGVTFTASGVGTGTGTAYSQIALPWFPVGYASIHNTSGVGTSTTGANISHTHTDAGHVHTQTSTNNGVAGGSNVLGPGSGSNATSTSFTLSGAASIQASGGTVNAAAGVYIMKCVKF